MHERPPQNDWEIFLKIVRSPERVFIKFALKGKVALATALVIFGGSGVLAYNFGFI